MDHKFFSFDGREFSAISFQAAAMPSLQNIQFIEEFNRIGQLIRFSVRIFNQVEPFYSFSWIIRVGNNPLPKSF